ncbi:Spy/CpxP family protein refolding chaperone [Cecembia calidifontis]|uniref:LTXXQ motif family protein n=1 Tax=Cecembia calidifontis TaxID=1187080 RepID=A0A4V2F6S4_9BACT|nr:Spy/CpxP family protein refolding chaperone [Cecembia calidifontis]RZS97329.1 LTXXQ motif family protein [Cecembia calidifontis]
MKKLTILAFFLCLATISMAQRGNQQYDQEKLEAARVAFITNRLDLKPSQAEKFWPVFNQYQDERKSMMEELSMLNRQAGREIDDEKAKELIHKRFELQDKLLAREKRFMSDIMQVISPSQAVKLGGANRDFTRQVYRMQQGRERSEGNKN